MNKKHGNNIKNSLLQMKKNKHYKKL